MAITSYVVAVGTSQVLVVEGVGGESYVTLRNDGPNEVYLDGPNDEVQNVALTGGPTGGTFTLTYSGQTTAGIAYNAEAQAVEDALVALSNIAPGEVDVTEGNDGLPSGFVSIRFTGAKGGVAQPALTGSGASLTGGSSPGVSITVIQQGGVDTADSYDLPSTGTVSFYIKGGDKLYGMCAAAESASVKVLRLG
jgi:hypothetical protein